MDGTIPMSRRTLAVLLAVFAVVATVGPVLAHDPEDEVQRESPPRPVLKLPDEAAIPLTGSYVVITMEFACIEEADMYLYGEIRQDSVVAYVQLHESRYLDCAGGTATEDIIVSGSQNQRFRPGHAVVELTGQICLYNERYLGCRRSTREKVIALSIEGIPLNPPF